MHRKIITLLILLIIVSVPFLIIASAHISNFHASRHNDGILLEWNTESENNVDRFEIQRSMDKMNWRKIDSVPSHSGNSSRQRYYQYLDTNNDLLKAGTSSINYRLIIVDLNGESAKYSVIASLTGSSGIKHTWGSLKNMFR